MSAIKKIKTLLSEEKKQVMAQKMSKQSKQYHRIANHEKKGFKG